jgi:hypothetical protein
MVFKSMKISTTHQEFAEVLENQRALDHPEEFLGPNWKDVLNFWLFIDTLTQEQWNSIRNAYYSLSRDELLGSQLAASDAARDDVWYDAWYAANAAVTVAMAVAGNSARYAGYASGYATQELIGSHILQEQGKSLVFLQMFLNV